MEERLKGTVFEGFHVSMITVGLCWMGFFALITIQGKRKCGSIWMLIYYHVLTIMHAYFKQNCALSTDDCE
jgi:hypothetical protein